MLSRWTMGASASKKARCPSPVASRIAWLSAGAVSGPVATMASPSAASGRPGISARCTRMAGASSIACCTASAKPVRSTARAWPAGTLWRSAAAITSESARRISSCRRPTALRSASSERKELEQTSSASRSLTWASVPRTGRISQSSTGTPRRAICHAASQPARPPPTIRIGFSTCPLSATASGLRPPCAGSAGPGGAVPPAPA